MSDIHKWNIVKSVLSSNIEDEIVIMNMDSGYYFSLDPVGSRIWELLSHKPVSSVELVDQLMEEYEIDKETCLNDVQVFINEMVSKKLIIPVEE